MIYRESNGKIMDGLSFLGREIKDLYGPNPLPKPLEEDVAIKDGSEEVLKLVFLDFISSGSNFFNVGFYY